MAELCKLSYGEIQKSTTTLGNNLIISALNTQAEFKLSESLEYGLIIGNIDLKKENVDFPDSYRATVQCAKRIMSHSDPL